MAKLENVFDQTGTDDEGRQWKLWNLMGAVRPYEYILAHSFDCVQDPEDVFTWVEISSKEELKEELISSGFRENDSLVVFCQSADDPEDGSEMVFAF